MALERDDRIHRFEMHGAGQQSSVRAQDLTPNGNLNLCLRLEPTDRDGGTIEKPGRVAELRFNSETLGGSVQVYVWSATGTAGRYRILLDDDFLGPADSVQLGKHSFGEFESRSELHRYAFEGRRGDHLSVIAHDPYEEDGTLQPHVEIFAKNAGTVRFDLVESGWRSSTFSVNTSLPSDGTYRAFLKDRLGGIGAYLLCVDKTNGLLGAPPEIVSRVGRQWLHDLGNPSSGLAALGLVAFIGPGVQQGQDLEIVFVVSYNDDRPEEILRIKDRSSIDLSSESGELVRVFGRVVDFRGKKVAVAVERGDGSSERTAGPGSSKILNPGERVAVRFKEVAWLELGDVVVADDRGGRGGGRGGGGGSCCVTCGSYTLCGCAVSTDCGFCCDACCGGGWAK